MVQLTKEGVFGIETSLLQNQRRHGDAPDLQCASLSLELRRSNQENLDSRVDRGEKDNLSVIFRCPIDGVTVSEIGRITLTVVDYDGFRRLTVRFFLRVRHGNLGVPARDFAIFWQHTGNCPVLYRIICHPVPIKFIFGQAHSIVKGQRLFLNDFGGARILLRGLHSGFS